MQTGQYAANVGSRLKRVKARKAPSERPAFQPYRGKPAVRNDRGDRGDVGIIRSPVRASVLPDQLRPCNRTRTARAPCLGRCTRLRARATSRPLARADAALDGEPAARDRAAGQSG